MKKTVYIPHKIRFWSGIKLVNPTLPMQTGIAPLPEHGIAFMPVFESLDALKEEYPDAEYFSAEMDTNEHQNLNA